MKKKAVFVPDGKWDHLPTVILAKEIEKQPWYQGEIKFSNERHDWEADNSAYSIPQFYITIPYRKQKIQMNVEWIQTSHTGSPVNAFQILPYTDNNRRKRVRASTYTLAISKIEDMIFDMLPILDQEADRLLKEEQEKQKLEVAKKTLKRDLGDLNLIDDKYYTDCTTYRASPSFAMTLVVTKDESDAKYKIGKIDGKFTVEEIKAILTIVGTNPRAVAERLLQ
jgi:hypothetical protein